MRLHGASSARVPSGHTQPAPHHVQAGQLYLRELRGLEACARVTREHSIAIDSHLVAVQTPPGSCWSLLVDLSPKVLSVQRSRSLAVEFHQRTRHLHIHFDLMIRFLPCSVLQFHAVSYQCRVNMKSLSPLADTGIPHPEIRRVFNSLGAAARTS